MKKIIAVLSVLLLVLVGCGGKEETFTKKPEKKLPDVKKEEVMKKLALDAANFRLVAGWLTNSEIVFVEKEATTYVVKSFNVETGEVKVVYTESSAIVNVLIHPSKEQLLIHTSDSPTTAVLKVLSQDGIVQHEISIESSELEIKWNDIDPSLILVTAFYEDWSYDVFIYNGVENKLRVLTLEDPFPKWLGTEEILYTKESNSGALYRYDRLLGTHSDLAINHMIGYTTYRDALLLMRKDEAEQMTYTIRHQDQTVLSEWKLPAYDNVFEWQRPDIYWLSVNQLLLSFAESGEQQERKDALAKLIQVKDGQESPIGEGVVSGPLSCSPNGEKCLVGYMFETMLDMQTKKSFSWLSLDE